MLVASLAMVIQTSSPAAGASLISTLRITSATLPTATAGMPYQVQITASGGYGQYRFSLVHGTLPLGLILETTGVIQGIPLSVSTTDSFVIGVTGQPGFTAVKRLSLPVGVAVGSPFLKYLFSHLPAKAPSSHPRTSPAPKSSLYLPDTLPQQEVGWTSHMTWTSPQPVTSSFNGGNYSTGINNVVSCVSSSFCMDAPYDDSPFTYAWNGTKWTPHAIPLIAGAILLSVSCASSSFCMAVGIEPNTNPSNTSAFLGFAISWNGNSWKSDTLPSSTNQFPAFLNGVSCVSSSFCIAAGSSTYYLNPSYIGEPTSQRIAIGGVEFLWNGNSWEALTANMDVVPTDVSCVSSSFCIMLGSTWLNGIDAYSSVEYSWSSTIGWTDQSLPSPPPSAVMNGLSCTSLVFCMALGFQWLSSIRGFAVESFFWNGTLWSSPDYFGSATLWGNSVLGAYSGFSISCTSSSFCIAVDDASGNAFTYNGISWSNSQQIDPISALESVSCTSSTSSTSSTSCTSSTSSTPPSFCMAVDDAGYYMMSTGPFPASHPHPHPPSPACQRQYVFVHGIHGNYLNFVHAIYDPKVGDPNFASILHSLHELCPSKKNVHIFAYYHDLGYAIPGTFTCKSGTPPPDTNVGPLYLDPGSTGGNTCNGNGALALDATALNQFIAGIKATHPGAPITVIANSMGGAVVRGWLRLAQADSPSDTTLSAVDSVIFLEGAQQGSIWAGLGELPGGRVLYDLVNKVPKLGPELKKFNLNPSDPGINDLAPQSAWYNSVNPAPLPSGIAYFNFAANIHITLNVDYLFGQSQLASIGLGDYVMLPGNDNPTAEPLLGGEDFLPGGKNIPNIHQFLLDDAHKATYKIVIGPINGLVAAGLIAMGRILGPVGATVGTILAIAMFMPADAAHDPTDHFNLPSNMGNGKVFVHDCYTKGTETPTNAILSIVANPTDACP